MRLSELVHQKVISRQTAEPVGEVHGFEVDPSKHRIVALRVVRGRRDVRLADWKSLVGAGPAAVVIESEDRLRGPADEREERVVKGEIGLLGRRVLSERGNVLGTVLDGELDETTGELASISVDGATVDASRLRAVGSYAVVVAEPADEEAPATAKP